MDTKKKVCIMGFAPSWVATPFDDPDFEIWTLNEAYKLLETRPNSCIDRWFEIHNPSSPSKNTKEHKEFLRTLTIPLYMQQKFDEFPTSVAYPRDAVKEMVNDSFIIDELGAPFSEFSNSITWMVLLAIYEGFQEIWVTGVDMAQTDEYAWQRSSCSFAIGFAAGAGIKVLIPKTSELCKFPKDYGWDTDNQSRIKLRELKKEYLTRQQTMQQQREKLLAQAHELERGMAELEGARGVIKHILNNHIV